MSANEMIICLDCGVPMFQQQGLAVEEWTLFCERCPQPSTNNENPPMLNNQVTPEQLASTFAEILRSWLTHEELVAIDAENRRRGDMSCASQDYCDANEAMHEAFWWELTGDDDRDHSPFGYEDGTEEHEDACRLWSDAWDIAKAAGFALTVTK